MDSYFFEKFSPVIIVGIFGVTLIGLITAIGEPINKKAELNRKLNVAKSERLERVRVHEEFANKPLDERPGFFVKLPHDTYISYDGPRPNLTLCQEQCKPNQPKMEFGLSTIQRQSNSILVTFNYKTFNRYFSFYLAGFADPNKVLLPYIIDEKSKKYYVNNIEGNTIFLREDGFKWDFYQHKSGWFEMTFPMVDEDVKMFSVVIPSRTWPKSVARYDYIQISAGRIKELRTKAGLE